MVSAMLTPSESYEPKPTADPRSNLHNESMSGPTLKSPAEHQFEEYLRMVPRTQRGLRWRPDSYVSAVMTLHERSYREDALERWHHDMKERLVDIEDRQERIALTYEATREPAFAEADATPGTYRFVRVFEAHHVGATALPVPRDLFVGVRDEFRAYNPENGCLELLRPPAGD